MDYYIDKVKDFNKRTDYTKDISTAKLFLEFCMPLIKSKKIFIIGTGLGGDYKIIKDVKKFKIIGIEPRQTFQEYALKEYKRSGATLLKMDLGEFSKISKDLSGIFLFIHSINHIPKNQIIALQKIIKNSYIIVINPNPKIERIVGKVDKTVISYLDSKKIQKLFNCEIIFNFYYNSKKIKGKDILLREALVLKTKD